MKLTRHADAVELPVSHDPDMIKRVLLKGGLAKPILQISEFTLLPGKIITAHQHDDATEIFYMLEGSVAFTVAGVKTVISAGDLLVIEPGEEHFCESVTPESARFFYFLMLTP